MLLSLLAQAQLGKQPVLVTDMLQLRSPGSVQLSPDGSRVAYTVTSIVPDEKNAGEHRYQTQVWVGSTTGQGAPEQFTFATEGASQPAWSPDGRQLAFVRLVEGTPQIFIASLQGGEPRQLTHLRSGASGPVWSPDGRQIAFTSSMTLRQFAADTSLPKDPRTPLPLYSLEKPGLDNAFLLPGKAMPNANGSIEEVRAYLRKNEEDKKAKVIHQLNFQQEATTTTDMSLTQVFLTGTAAGAQARMLSRMYISTVRPQFIPGSPFLLVESGYFTKYHPDRQQERGIYTLDTTNGKVKRVQADTALSFGSAALSPGGKWLAYQKSPTMRVGVAQLLVEPLNGSGPPQVVPIDRSVGNVQFSDDEKWLYFTAASNGGTVLYRYELSSRKLTRLTGFDEGISSYDLRSGKLVYSSHSTQYPGEVYVADANAANPRRMSNLNGWVQNKQLSLPVKDSFVNALGLTVEYWVMRPANYEPGKKYPLLLEIHGGPSAMWGPGESSMWHEYQYFCSKGYGVVYCNPRGSGGYGEAFLRANVQDWGSGPMADVMTALDKAVAQGWADTSRLLVTGGSYAGYLVSYILGHSQRFAAACAQRGVYDLRTFFGEGNAWRLVPNYFGGYPWQPETLAVLERESPINYVANIHTPLIIFHGEQDLRTGVIQSEQLYKSLKVLGRPVEYVRHPGATHEITRSGNNRQRIDQMLRTWEFFERFVGGINEGERSQ